ncbi:hypothetical protein GBZ26_22890 [Azospirillum formosense]|uniref:Phage tail protein n=1 Tax=Azospirillum formosense TaxID=861533 RepID=A0ABX2L9N1_9PROT|nr:hypothetical protein [Azospirillum formosense]MBY3752498.1 hypothetical protein [Azospirillum formosense]NUB22020.1 hypothetical protein [Azospirillum formosense]
MSGEAVSSAGTRLFIGGSTPCDTKAEYEALTWVEVEEIEDIGSFGTTFEKVSYKALAGGTVRKKKGTVDHGSTTLKLARIPTATGQTAIKAAVADRQHAYNVKIEFDDKPAGAGATPTRIYMPAFVMSYTTEIGGPDKVVETSVGLEIDGEPLEVAADDGP